MATRPKPITAIHANDPAWIIQLWIAIHGGDPAPELSPAAIEKGAIGAIRALATRLDAPQQRAVIAALGH
ncbi:hypothetical protein [Sphingomonas profundi]|uniref:hypothetical protein n=1 Tax=Alterirhizorhabdus profundi TaxID=2681549 RepID=UPI0012E75E4A|nr:hypothetical protein [Sphingomonas profundi]